MDTFERAIVETPKQITRRRRSVEENQSFRSTKFFSRRASFRSDKKSPRGQLSRIMWARVLPTGLNERTVPQRCPQGIRLNLHIAIGIRRLRIIGSEAGCRVR